MPPSERDETIRFHPHPSDSGSGRRRGPTPGGRLRGLVRMGFSVACGLYAAAVLGGLVLLRWSGDTWWPSILMLYGPRWVWAIPLVVLIPAAAIAHRRCMPTLLVLALVVAGPVMGLCIPWRTGFGLATRAGRMPIRVLTCNVHYTDLDQRALRDLIREAAPEIIVVQEWSPSRYDAATLAPGPGWHVDIRGEFAIASRFPIVGVEPCRPYPGASRTAVRYTLKAPGGVIDVINVHPASVSDGIWAVRVNGLGGLAALERNTTNRWRESLATSRWAAGSDRPLLLVGDFNTPGDGPLYQTCWSGYQDAFATAGFGLGHTWYGHWWHGLRIDHILTGPGWVVQHCWVGPDVGSDHRPLIAVVARQ